MWQSREPSVISEAEHEYKRVLNGIIWCISGHFEMSDIGVTPIAFY